MTIRPLENYFYDPQFQRIFRAYFAEIGITLREDTTLWDEIKKSADEEGMVCLAAQEDGALVGFIMLQSEPMTSRSGFFSMFLGFIRELWVAPERRRSGLGRALIQQAEALLRDQARSCWRSLPPPPPSAFTLRWALRKTAACGQKTASACSAGRSDNGKRGADICLLLVSFIAHTALIARP